MPVTPLAQESSFEVWLHRVVTRVGILTISAAAAIEPMIAAEDDHFNPVRQGAVLSVLILLHLFMRPFLLVTRELVIYAVFTVYMFITLLWAPSVETGFNTLLPAIDFMLIILLFGSLVSFHSVRAVLAGAVGGFVLGAYAYTKTVGFPFKVPSYFSYNAIAGMYLFGLFMTLMYAWYTRRRLLPMLIVVIVLVLIAATTSIKTNLGIALGAGAAALVYFSRFLRLISRNAIPLGILVAAAAYMIVGNAQLQERVGYGFERVSRGVEILQQREDVSGHTSFASRETWQREGIRGWLNSPMFGNGVEAFRVDFGITSHATPIDLLYNFGVVGLLLFYSIFASMVLRLASLRRGELGSLPPLIFGGVVCYSFMSLSETLHYNACLGAFIGVALALLRRFGAADSQQ
jgi:hypothetical protein